MKKFLGITIILGIILRLIFIDKPDGLWNDEYISWMIASSTDNFWHEVKAQCHMPIYYMYLKLFMLVFGNSDLALRLSSVITGIASIPIMYLIGKENNEKTGIICAGFTAICPFLIYYSQEVRLYSLLFLLSCCSLLYTIKLIKSTNLLNISLYTIFNFLIIATHTIGFVYIFFNLLFISINLIKKYKKQIIILWIAITSGLILCSPLIIKIFTTQSFSQWWGHFSISKIAFLFTDYFSPVLTNLTNAPDNFLYMPKLAFFMIIPTVIAIYGIVAAIIKNKINQQLFCIFIGVIVILTIASICGRLVFITKYSIEILPILIYLACFGISNNKNTALKIILICCYILITTGYTIFHPYSAPKMRRAEGHKLMTNMLSRTNIRPDDYVILLYYPKQRFEKYFDFSKYNVISINKGNFPYYISKNVTYENAFKNGKLLYKNIFSNNNNPYFENILSKDILNNLQTGQSVVLVVLDSVSFYSPEDLDKIVQDRTLYDKTPLLFLVFSYIRNETFEYIVKSLAVTQIERKGNWTVVKFTKLNN